MTKPEDDKPSTIQTKEMTKAKHWIVESITDAQYSKQKGPKYGTFLAKSLTIPQKKEIKKKSQEGFICVEPRHRRWLPGTFSGRKNMTGRQKGTRNKYVDVTSILADIGCNPILGLARIAMNKKNDPALRAKCYTELAQYQHPKMKAVDRASGDSNEHNTLTVKLVGGDPRAIGYDVEEAEVLPYEEDGLVNEAHPDGYPEGLTDEDWDKVEAKS